MLPPVDWTVAEARKLSALARKHGLKARVVRCKHTDSYCAIYRVVGDPDHDGEAYSAKWSAMKADPEFLTIDAYHSIVRVESS